MGEQVVEGLFRGLGYLLIAGFAYGFFVLGKSVVEGAAETTTPMSKSKATVCAIVIALLLGAMASRDFEWRDGSGDMLLDEGEVVEVAKNHRPYESFMSVFTFVAVPLCAGIAKATSAIPNPKPGDKHE